MGGGYLRRGLFVWRSGIWGVLFGENCLFVWGDSYQLASESFHMKFERFRIYWLLVCDIRRYSCFLDLFPNIVLGTLYSFILFVWESK